MLKQGLVLDEIFRKLGKGRRHARDERRVAGHARHRKSRRRRRRHGRKLAIDAFVESVRRYIGEYLVVLGGCDCLAFTGGIGENGIAIREAICRNLQWAGIELDHAKEPGRGKETKISTVESECEIWIVPTNEEMIVAEQTVAVLTAN